MNGQAWYSNSMSKQTLTYCDLMRRALAGLLFGLMTVGAAYPTLAAGNQGNWKVEIESKADSTDKGKMTYRLTAQQGLVEPSWRPLMTVSNETRTFSPTPEGAQKITVIKYLILNVIFHEPDLTCDAVTIHLLPPTAGDDIATKPVLHFRQDFLGPGFSFQVKIPRGYHYVAGSVQSSRTSGLLPSQKPRTFVKPPEYAKTADTANPHLLSVLLPEPEPRVPGTGYDAPYGIEFTMAPD